MITYLRRTHQYVLICFVLRSDNKVNSFSDLIRTQKTQNLFWKRISSLLFAVMTVGKTCRVPPYMCLHLGCPPSKMSKRGCEIGALEAAVGVRLVRAVWFHLLHK